MVHIDQELLNAYASSFITYGDRRAPYWFLGLEEGGGKDPNEIQNILNEWNMEERPTNWSFDIKAQPGKPGFDFFDNNRKGGVVLQKTWSQQIRVLLNASDQECNTQTIKQYQANYLGRSNTPDGVAASCLMELYPLPRANHGEWIYNQISTLPQLSSLNTYKSHYTKSRLLTIEKLIGKHNPKFVLATCWGSRTLFKNWLVDCEEFIGPGDNPGKALFGWIGSTRFAVTYHPANYFSDRNSFYEQIGKKIRSDIEGLPQNKVA